MALRGFWGFDDANDPTFTLVTGGVTNGGRTGNYLNLGGSISSFPLNTTAGTAIFGFASFLTTAVGAASNALQFREGTTIHCGVGLSATGFLTIYGPAGTVVATATTAVTASVYQYIEAKAVIADSGGSVEIRLGESVLLTYTGDTRNAGTGVVDNVGIKNFTNSTNAHRIDDAYLLDDTGSSPFNAYLGDVAVRQLVPTGVGDSTQWTPSSAVANWTTVDEAAVNTTDYVAASTTGLTDLYAATDVPTTDAVYAYRQSTWIQKSDAGTPPAVKPVQKGAAGTVREETAIAAASISTTQQNLSAAINLTDPDGNALTATRVNGMQVGVRSA